MLSRSRTVSESNVHPGLRRAAELKSVRKKVVKRRPIKRAGKEAKTFAQNFKKALKSMKADVCVCSQTAVSHCYGVLIISGDTRLLHVPPHETRRVNEWKEILRTYWIAGDVSADGTDSDPISDAQITYNILQDKGKVTAWSRDADGNVKGMSAEDIAGTHMCSILAGVLEDYIPACRVYVDKAVVPTGHDDSTFSFDGNDDALADEHVQVDLVCKDVPATAFETKKRGNLPETDTVLFRRGYGTNSELRFIFDAATGDPLAVRRTMGGDTVCLAFRNFSSPPKLRKSDFAVPKGVKPWKKSGKVGPPRNPGARPRKRARKDGVASSGAGSNDSSSSVGSDDSDGSGSGGSDGDDDDDGDADGDGDDDDDDSDSAASASAASDVSGASEADDSSPKSASEQATAVPGPGTTRSRKGSGATRRRRQASGTGTRARRRGSAAASGATRSKATKRPAAPDAKDVKKNPGKEKGGGCCTCC